MGKRIGYTRDSYGNKKYDCFLRQEDKIKMRECRERKRKLTPTEKLEIFGDKNPEFYER